MATLPHRVENFLPLAADDPLVLCWMWKIQSIHEFFKTATVPSLEKALGLGQRDVFAVQTTEVAA